MAFIRTIPEAEATGAVATIYEGARQPDGLTPNYVKSFSLRPAVWQAAGPLITAIKANMDPRRYTLVTLAAALELGSSYCSLVYGTALSKQYLGPEQTEALARDYREANLPPVDQAIVTFVRKLVRRAADVMQEDIDGLRAHGLTDEEIFDIVTTASLRCFFSKVFDAVGTEPDAFYADTDAGLRDALTVGRAIQRR